MTPVPTTAPQDRYIAPEMADWTKVYRVGHNLLIPAAVNQSAVKLFILDTGTSSTTISPEAAREVTKLHNDYNMKVRGISGKVDKVYSTGQMMFDFANLRQPASEVVAFDVSNVRVKIDYRDALVKFEYDPKRGYRSVF